MKNFGESFKFLCKLFIKFLTILQKSLMSTFVLNIPSNRNFGDAIVVQDLRGIHVYNFFDVPLEPKSWSRPCIQYILYIYQLSLVPPPPNFYTWRTPCSGIHVANKCLAPLRCSARVPLALRSPSVCVPSTMNWPLNRYVSSSLLGVMCNVQPIQRV